MPAPTEIKTERLLLRPFRLNGRRMTCTHTRKILSGVVFCRYRRHTNFDAR